VPVDGELVFGGERAALAANFGKLFLAGEGNGRRSLRQVGNPSRAERFPAQPVVAVDRFGGIDEAVPKFVERLEQTPFERIDAESGIHFQTPWGWMVFIEMSKDEARRTKEGRNPNVEMALLAVFTSPSGTNSFTQSRKG
jgi:hypothetical protein